MQKLRQASSIRPGIAHRDQQASAGSGHARAQARRCTAAGGTRSRVSVASGKRSPTWCHQTCPVGTKNTTYFLKQTQRLQQAIGSAPLGVPKPSQTQLEPKANNSFTASHFALFVNRKGPYRPVCSEGKGRKATRHLAAPGSSGNSRTSQTPGDPPRPPRLRAVTRHARLIGDRRRHQLC